MIGPSSVAFHLSVRTTWTPTEGTSEMSSATSECHPAWGREETRGMARFYGDPLDSWALLMGEGL